MQQATRALAASLKERLGTEVRAVSAREVKNMDLILPMELSLYG